ncbi:putative pyruvate dehydrogenase [Patulibacter medicamentivorans]|uniref:Putative pyruvate dehydrogenase n=1 Tax=Patulibacter medicamentivorans TaxID=1097667 RepID=H0E023_9ACTN|nr:transketolase C-terminal domain-containing protein [Patulibacter medicamentivorans]EHN12982.1 putative pyruvate dehydrogenase [Patulibacter medicamentivorans]
MSTEIATKSTKYWQGISQALTEEMDRDERVVLVGEDVGRAGGPYGLTRGLQDRFGADRVRDTPISEAVLMGLGVGSGAVGLRPIVEVMFFDFAMLMMDQLINQGAKYRYFTGHPLPLTVRAMCGAGGHNGAQHSQNIEAWFCGVPGLKVAMSSNARDAKGLLKSAVRDDDPTLIIETQGLLRDRFDVPVVDDLLIPLGVADVRRTGTDVTVVATGRMVPRAVEAAEGLADEISVEVVDPRTISPLDTATILESVAKTGRLVVAQEALSPCSVAAEVCSLAAEHCFAELKAPPVRVTPDFTNVPTPLPLVEARVPQADTIAAAIRTTLA